MEFNPSVPLFSPTFAVQGASWTAHAYENDVLVDQYGRTACIDDNTTSALILRPGSSPMLDGAGATWKITTQAGATVRSSTDDAGTPTYNNGQGIPVTTDAVGYALDCARTIGVSVTISVSTGGTPEGTIKMQVNNLFDTGDGAASQNWNMVGPSYTDPGWTDDPATTASNAFSNPSAPFIIFSSTPARWRRLVYKSTSGTGTITYSFYAQPAAGG